MSDYKTTGKNIPISVEDVMNYVFSELDRYDKLVETSGSKPNISPYEQQLVYTLEDGRQVKIPENIQMEAIDSWNKGKQSQVNVEGVESNISGVMDINNSHFDQIQHEVPVEMEPVKQHNEAQKPVEEIKKQTKKSSKSNVNWKMIVGLIIVLLICFYIYKTKFKGKIPVSPNGNWIN